MARIILNFHGLGTPHDGVPEDEAPYWLPADRFAQIVEQIAGKRDSIELTFDDGNRSDLDIATPLLTAHGLRATFFILTGRFGQPRYLSPHDVRALMAAGMDIGLHGQDHIDWRAAPPQVLETETATARQRLAEVTGVPVAAVSIPFGAYNRHVIAHLKAQDFAAIYTSDGGAAGPDGLIRSRTSLRSDMTADRIGDIMRGREKAKTRLRRAMSTFLRRRVI